MKAEWLTPVLAGGIQDPGWIDSLRLLRMHAGDEAIPALLSQLDFDVVWSDRNWWILNEVQACPKAPPVKYEYDLNTGGTPEQWETNRRTLQSLKPVSYTHLDVYKRQFQPCSANSILTWSGVTGIGGS